MISSRAAWIAGLGASAVLGSAAGADVVSLTPSRDTSIYETPATASNGAGEALFSGQTNFAGLRRALIRFDLSSIPAGATVTSVRLDMQVLQTIGPAGVSDIHRLTADWGEAGSDATLRGGRGAAALTGDATWLTRFFNTATWATRGGDFAPVPSGTAAVSGVGAVTWMSTPAMVADVQQWVNTPATNFGWIILSDEDLPGNARKFGSRENLDPAARPLLTVAFTRPASSCPADFNNSGAVSVQDIFDFLAAYFANDPRADFNHSGAISVQDIFDFLAAYFTGC